MADRLPIYDIEHDIVARLRDDRRLILSAPTGSGKSTQVSQMLLKHGLLGAGQVVVLQPRRLATRLLAARVASELGVKLGEEVGYQIRFENVTSAKTKIRFVTEGVLLRQMIDDPQLRGVSAILFDEFHERHLYGDITLAQALDQQEKHRPDLMLAVMSATLNAGELERYLNIVRRPLTPSLSPDGGEGAGRSVVGTLPRASFSPTGGEGGRRPDEGATQFRCSVLASEGRTFPVEVEYLPHRVGANGPPVWELAAEEFARYVAGGGEGDVLVFMPGGFEISQTIDAIRNSREAKGFIVLPLHGELQPRDQDAAVARYQQRKVVVATNVAETSITIDGVRLVIDSGLARIARYDSNRGINTLLIEKISQANADQRTGRAGRTAPGTCVRLWSRAEHDERVPHEMPEIRRLDLSEVVLTLKASGVEDLRAFRWLEKPDEISLTHAEELLEDLGAIKAVAAVCDRRDGDTKEVGGHRPPLQITPIGRKMLAFPLHPRYARMLLAAQEYHCVYQACLVAALTQGRDLLIRNAGKDVETAREDLLGEKASSDFWIVMRAWSYAFNNQFRMDACRKLGIHAVTAKQVGPLFDQFLRIAKDEGLDTKPNEVKDENLQKCILIGFSDRVARRMDQGTLRCELVHGRRGVLARESRVQSSPLFVVAEIREIEGRESLRTATGRELNTILSLATAIEVEWLKELFPDDIKSDVHVQFDAREKRVLAAELLRFRDLALAAKRIDPPPADAAARLLADEILAGRLLLPNWDHHVEQWLARLSLLCKECADLQLPAITEEDKKAIIEQLCHGAVSYKDIKEREVKPIVTSWLSHTQRELLDKHAPERLTLANGRTPKVNYEPGRAPFISLRIQELYDVTQTPRIALNRVPVTVHILTPGMKPIQVTQDLANFWREHYPKIKSELARKYPKHFWR